MSNAVIRIKPFFYIHVLDNNTNVTRVVEGPQTFTRMDHETVVSGPDAMVMVPPRHYCIIQNPVMREGDDVQMDAYGQAKIRHGDEEIRFEQDPFALYPGETLYSKVSPLQVVAPNTAIRLRAIRDFVADEVERKAGDEWLFEGPATYIPRIEVQLLAVERATIVHDNQALRLRARDAFVDRSGVARKAGEEWIVRDSGAYLPDVNEEIRDTLSAYVLTEKKALQLEALRTFEDVFGSERKAGQQWLVTFEDAETHIPDVHEKVIGEVNITTLDSRQYCVVLDPVVDGKQKMGGRQLRKGEANFFLQPGERLESGIQQVHILDSEEGLLLRAREQFADGDETRQPGDRWTLLGPCEYVPPVTVEIVEKRRTIPLDENEGIYVRDITTGEVRSVTGQSYMLTENEELWEKYLSPQVESLLGKEGRYDGSRGDKRSRKSTTRDKTRLVTYRAPHNSAVQVYDYKKKHARVVFGPDLVMLGPDEEFTVLSLSGDVPKRPGQIHSLALLLGPDFMTDVVVVETSDHARLSLKLSYNWKFDIDSTDSEGASDIFNVPDFVGDACKAIASRVRGCVAQHSFDNFHKGSARIIREAVFGANEEGKIGDRFEFPSNRLVVTNIDIQSVEPVDSRTRDALQKSVQLAIEITTKSQEAAARHEAARREQQAKGKLERQKIQDDADAEAAKTKLLSFQATSAAVEATGLAKAEAQAKASSSEIEAQAAVKQAELSSRAKSIREQANIAQQTAKQNAEINHRRKVIELEIKKAQELAAIEVKKFQNAVDAIGTETITAIAQAGPQMQAELLAGLGLESFVITDGNSPINLFNTAKGMIGGN